LPVRPPASPSEGERWDVRLRGVSWDAI